MNVIMGSALFAFALFLAMLAAIEIGRRLGARRLALDPEGGRAGAGAVDAAVFALLGLLIAFTFGGAAARFDARRQLIVEEANDIGTAYLRIDLLPAERQPALRERFRQYVDARLAAYRAMPDMTRVNAELARAATLQGEIWTLAVAGCREAPSPQAAMLLLPALNAMIDITTTRSMAAEMHAPQIIFGLLAALSLVCAVLAGHGMGGGRKRNWLHSVGFAAVLAVTVYVILDLEYPRMGLIDLARYDHVLADVRAGMK